MNLASLEKRECFINKLFEIAKFNSSRYRHVLVGLLALEGSIIYEVSKLLIITSYGVSLTSLSLILDNVGETFQL